MFEWIQINSASITVIATIALVSVTAFYAYLTWRILRATEVQSKLSLDPVIGITIKEGGISEVFGPDRRNMSFKLELVNVGNAPAIEVLVDAEITFRHTNIKGRKTVPARFEPDVIPFIQPSEKNEECSPNFGNKAIVHFFDDVRESLRLNWHRIDTDPTRESFDASRLRIICYYRNSLSQIFKSYYETEIDLWGDDPKDPIPDEKENKEISMPRLPRPEFHAEPITRDLMDEELSNRKSIRKLSGW
jgi:hypothetical protein